MIQSTYSFDLHFVSPYPLRDSDLPGHATAKVMVKTFCTDKEGFPLIGLECVSFREFEHEIDTLIEELEEVKRAAKRKFALHDEREQQWRASLGIR